MGSLVRRAPDRRLVRWVLTIALALVAGLVAASAVARAEQVRASYGERRRVPVAIADLAPGDRLAATDVSWVDRPVALVAADPADDPVGRVVADPVAAGEVVLERRLAGGGGAEALAPPGSRLVAVPVDLPLPPVEVADRVDAYAPVIASSSPAAIGAAARRVARDAVVVAVTEDGVTLAVTEAEAPATARAVLDGAVVLAAAAPG